MAGMYRVILAAGRGELLSIAAGIGIIATGLVIRTDTATRVASFILEILGWGSVAAGIVAIVVGIYLYGNKRNWWDPVIVFLQQKNLLPINIEPNASQSAGEPSGRGELIAIAAGVGIIATGLIIRTDTATRIASFILEILGWGSAAAGIVVIGAGIYVYGNKRGWWNPVIVFLQQKNLMPMVNIEHSASHPDSESEGQAESLVPTLSAEPTFLTDGKPAECSEKNPIPLLRIASSGVFILILPFFLLPWTTHIYVDDRGNEESVSFAGMEWLSSDIVASAIEDFVDDPFDVDSLYFLIDFFAISIVFLLAIAGGALFFLRDDRRRNRLNHRIGWAGLAALIVYAVSDLVIVAAGWYEIGINELFDGQGTELRFGSGYWLSLLAFIASLILPRILPAVVNLGESSTPVANRGENNMPPMLRDIVSSGVFILILPFSFLGWVEFHVLREGEPLFIVKGILGITLDLLFDNESALPNTWGSRGIANYIEEYSLFFQVELLCLILMPLLAIAGGALFFMSDGIKRNWLYLALACAGLAAMMIFTASMLVTALDIVGPESPLFTIIQFGVGYWLTLLAFIAVIALRPGVIISAAKDIRIKAPVASMVLGISGSVLISGLLLEAAFAYFDGANIAITAAWILALAPIAALIGAILTKNNPKVGGAIMLAAAALLVPYDVGFFAEFGNILLIIGGALALVARMQQPQSQARASMVIGIFGAALMSDSFWWDVLQGEAYEFAYFRTLITENWLALLVSSVALVGAILAKNNPKVGGTIMLAVAILGGLFAEQGLGMGNMLLIISGMLAFAALMRRRQAESAT